MTAQKQNLNQNQPKSTGIPDFANRQKMAEWWETHNIADYVDELEPVEVKFNTKDLNKFHPSLTENINIRVKPEIAVKLHQWALRKGLGLSTLARMWLTERLEEENKAGSSEGNFNHK